MLTKEERAAIAERTNKVTFNSGSIYEAILGPSLSNCRTLKDEFEAMIDKIIDLCDTTNMIELPVDKDGVPFKRGDTVYESDGTEHIVDGYAFSRANAKIVSVVDLINNTRILFETDELTHKRPVTIASLVSEIRHTISKSTVIDKETISKLWGITDRLEKLGDSNAN